MARGDRAFAGNLQQQRAGAAHLFLQEPGSGVFGFRLQRIGADEFSKVSSLVSRSRSLRSHFEEFDIDAAPGTLPSRFRAGQTGTDNANESAHDVGRARSRIDVSRDRMKV